MKSKPEFTIARVIKTPVEEEADLVLWPKTDALKLRGDADDELIRGGVHCHGWHTVQCIMLLEGGSSPTVAVQPLEIVEYTNEEGTKLDVLVPVCQTTAALLHGETFDVPVRGGRLHFRVHAETGTPTLATILIAGVERDLEALRVG